MPLRLHRAAIIFALTAGFGAFCAHAAPTPAAPAAQPMAALYGCAALTDAAARLACYDSEVGKLRAAETAGNFKAIDRQAVEQLEKESFGFQLPSLPRFALPKLGGSEKSAPDKQTYEIAAVRRGALTGYVMTDGSVWRQVEAAENVHVKRGATVVIEKAALNSFMLSPTKGGGRGLRVRREQ